jgi:lipoyl(octanoyl) transferase
MKNDGHTEERRQVVFRDLGQISFAEAWEIQTKINEALKAAKKADNPDPTYDVLLFCEHDSVYTLGKSGDETHLRISEDELAAQQITYYKINRGGDITYHGPGQIVGYPIFDLDHFFTDVHRYVRSLEEVVIRTLSDFGLKAGRITKFTGVWLDIESAHPRKICAIGVHLSRWVTMHGFALNVNTDLSHYRHIVPCGIDTNEKPVTTMAAELNTEIPISQVKDALRRHFADVFDFTYLNAQKIKTTV